MSAAVPSTPSPGPARIIPLDVSRAVSKAASPREAGETFVRKLIDVSEIDLAALWIRPELLGETGGRFRLVLALPNTRGAEDVLESDHPLSEWADAHRAFSWQVSDVSYSAADRDPFFGRGLFVQFCLEGDLLLKLHASDRIIAAPQEIRGIQRTLVELLAYIEGGETTEHPSESETGPRETSPFIDLAFLEATAMGDADFMGHIIELSIVEIREAVNRLSEATLSGDRPAVVFIAHKLRSTGRTIGAEGLDQILGQIERDGLNLEAEELNQLTSKARSCARDVLKALEGV